MGDGQRFFDQLISSFMEDGMMGDTVEQVTAKTVILALELGAGYYFISLAWNFLKNVMNKLRNEEQGNIFDLKEFSRVIAILILIGAYIPVMEGVNDVVTVVNKQTVPTKEQNSKLERKAQNFYNKTHFSKERMALQKVNRILDMANNNAEVKKELGPKRMEWLRQKKKKLKKQVAAQGVTSINENDGGILANVRKIAHILAKPQSIMTMGINAIVRAIASQIKTIITILALVATKIFIIIGPLALASSIIPAWSEKMDQWFQTYLTLAFVFTTFNILDHLSFELMDSLSHVEARTMMNFNHAMAVNISLIVAYFLIFWITSKWIGSSNAGRFVSKAVMFGTAAVSAGVSAGLGAVGGGVAAGGGGKAVNNVASSVKNLSKDDDQQQ